jgi:diacylglycerol kinase family enzyme
MTQSLERDRALIIANPHSRLAAALDWRAVAIAAMERRYAAELSEPRDADDTVRVAHEAAAQGYAVVVAAGGDGTVNAVARGIARTRTALGIFPLGSANDLAREYAIPLDIAAAARRIAEREARSVDLGELDGRVFCGVGGLALVSRAALAVTRVKQMGGVARRATNLLGRHVYRLSATAALLGRWRLDERIRFDYLDAERGGRLKFETFASAVFVTNHRTLGGGMVLPVDANAGDGVLELCYVPSRPRHSLLLNFARLSAGTPIPAGVLVSVRATEATIETSREDAFVADGELLARGRCFSVKVLPKALRIIA